MKRGELEFTPEEQRGYDLFKNKCATCHPDPLFTDHTFRNTGLAANSRNRDSGRDRITNDPSDAYKFKVPSLRNVELTSPYGHDGRFPTLSSVLDHYRFKIGNDPLIDPLLRGGIPLDEGEKVALITFLRSLTDRDFVSNEKFRDPVRGNSASSKIGLHH
jgi:cytochrome c peroxidase